ncbi:MAG: hypothetical protein ACNA8L_10285 [Luteolibacter sp.]
MRISDFQIIWAPGTGEEKILLALGDTMDSEIRMPLAQLVDVGRPDFQKGGLPVSRGNRRRRLEFSVRTEHASVNAAWLAVFAALAWSPWGEKQTIRITPRGGTARNHPAVMMACRHEVAKGSGLAETIHQYTFRLGGPTSWAS